MSDRDDWTDVDERAALQGWAEDAFAFKAGDLDYLTDMEIRSRVEIHYDGGLRQFREDGA